MPQAIDPVFRKLFAKTKSKSSPVAQRREGFILGKRSPVAPRQDRRTRQRLVRQLSIVRAVDPPSNSANLSRNDRATVFGHKNRSRRCRSRRKNQAKVLSDGATHGSDIAYFSRCSNTHPVHARDYLPNPGSALDVKVDGSVGIAKQAISSAFRTNSFPCAMTGWFHVLPSIALKRPSSLCPEGSASTTAISPVSVATSSCRF